MTRVGTLEAGGTKMVVGIADENARILRRETFPTLTPETTVPAILSFFRGEDIAALGVASFGPVGLREGAENYGDILNTPKLAWRHYPLMRTLRDALSVPCAVDTDVNAAALAEARMGAAKGLSCCLYLTVGTGIGGGQYADGRLAHGMLHPEWGHILLSPHKDDPMSQGCCPYHAGCAEGLASGPSIEKRWGKKGAELPPDHPAWALEAHYLAQLCMAALCTISPERILLGGGVMGQAALLPMVRREFSRLVGGYIETPELADLDSYISAPALYPDSGLIGGALLALDLLETK